MFFILSILIIILVLIAILMFSKIEIAIKNFKISTDKINNRHIKENYKFIIKLKLFKIKILELIITKKQLEKFNIKEKLEKQIVQSNAKVDLDVLKELKNLQFKILNLNLIIKIGTENAGLTAILTGVLSAIIGILLKDKILDDKENNFKIIPVYINKNLLNIELDCIISFKMIHIIYMLYILNKKRRDDEYVRTSDRRTYAYSNE